ncbi:MAG: ribosome maturation factor RimP [Actinomycetota bacterium]|nr:ribosome maturation factor RimP [Actinomycetota bacterium]
MSLSAVRAIAEPVVVAAGLDLEDLAIEKVGRREKVSVIVDTDGGVSLDAIAEVSSALSAALDEAGDVASSSYVLEVSSPGVDRPLTLPRHWRRNTGRLVAIDLEDGSSITGRLTGSDDSTVTLDVNGEAQQLVLGQVQRAIVQVEFSREEG